MDSAAANAVLNRISNSVRAVTRLMTMTNANGEVCLSEVDSIMRQRGAVGISQAHRPKSESKPAACVNTMELYLLALSKVWIKP